VALENGSGRGVFRFRRKAGATYRQIAQQLGGRCVTLRWGFSSRRRVIVSKSVGQSGLNWLGRSGVSLRWRIAIETAEGPSKGTRPESMRYKMTPSEYKSLAGVAGASPRPAAAPRSGAV
jgi:hypothetical protein